MITVINTDDFNHLGDYLTKPLFFYFLPSFFNMNSKTSLAC